MLQQRQFPKESIRVPLSTFCVLYAPPSRNLVIRELRSLNSFIGPTIIHDNGHCELFDDCPICLSDVRRSSIESFRRSERYSTGTQDLYSKVQTFWLYSHSTVKYITTSTYSTEYSTVQYSRVLYSMIYYAILYRSSAYYSTVHYLLQYRVQYCSIRCRESHERSINDTRRRITHASLTPVQYCTVGTVLEAKSAARANKRGRRVQLPISSLYCKPIQCKVSLQPSTIILHNPYCNPSLRAASLLE